MKPAAKVMEDKINRTNFQNPSIDIISNVTAEPIKDSVKIQTNSAQKVLV